MNEIIRVSNELAAFTERGLMSPEDQKKLSLAVSTLGTMKQVSTPIGKRHFSRIDKMLSMKNPTPASQARDCLYALDAAWTHIRGDFHKYREMHAQVKLLRAKLNKRLKEAPEDEDDKAIVEAECYLEEIKIQSLESELAAGEEKLKGALGKAKVQSDQYALICKNAGKEQFTEEDFSREEAAYLIKSAWWHAIQVFVTVDVRNAKWREKENKPEQVRKGTQMELEEDVLLYFKGLGIDEGTVKSEVALIEAQRVMHERHYELADEGVRQPFRPYFEAWLEQMALKYVPNAMAVMKAQGMERIRNTDALITPTNDDKGTGSGGLLPRKSLLQ